MRDSFLLFAPILLLAPSVALAEGCPSGVTPELEAALGEPVAWLGAGQTVHTPAGLTMLGQPVGYVIAKRSGEGAAIGELDYRLQGAVRAFGERYPDDLRRAFDKEAPGAGCGGSNGGSCVVGVNSRGEPGQLSGVELGQGNLSVPADARGPALALVEADYDLEDADPVFLVCLFEAGS